MRRRGSASQAGKSAVGGLCASVRTEAKRERTVRSMSYETLLDVLERNRDIDRTITYLGAGGTERKLAYSGLHERALGILYHLQALGLGPGDRLILFLEDNEQILDAFWAATAGKIVPVPLSVGSTDEHRLKLLRVARKLGRPWLYTTAKNLARLETLARRSNDAPLFAELEARCFLVESLTDISRPGKIHAPEPDDLALIQFSSGSTMEPKGVMLSHRNLVTNTRDVLEVGRLCDRDVSLSWMPLTHDMGLIGFFIMQFAARATIILMATELFVRRPVLWLETASRNRATITCSPNFGYRHFLKVLGDRRLEAIDLSALRLIYNGAEPISVELCREFLDRLRYTGLRPQAMYPVYGLAEASLAVSLPAIDTPFRSLRVNRHSLSTGSPVSLEMSDARDGLDLMNVGKPVPRIELCITDDHRRPLGAGLVGHILIRGQSVTRGYVGDPETTRSAIDADGWLDTGDLGVLREGELYITGRSKEIIVVNGQNYYPYDLENIAVRAPGLELGKVVVGGLRPPGAASEDLVVFVLHRGSPAEFLPTALAVSGLLREQAGLEVAAVVPVARIAKTTSGKVQRHQLIKSFADGDFDAALALLAQLRESQGPAGDAAASLGLEARLLDICAQALPGKPIGVSDNLFEIGASSLKLIEIHESIDQAYPGAIDLTEIFEHPTIERLARHLAAKLHQASSAATADQERIAV
jgi:acyl-CoA synthetase (AMP-forming)/AMP-acid ligase II/aryl carrier-like protein